MKGKNYRGKVGIITSSSQRIGKATSIELYRRGGSMILNRPTQNKLKKAELELLDQDFDIKAIQADVISLKDCQKSECANLQTKERPSTFFLLILER